MCFKFDYKIGLSGYKIVIHAQTRLRKSLCMRSLTVQLREIRLDFFLKPPTPLPLSNSSPSYLRFRL